MDERKIDRADEETRIDLSRFGREFGCVLRRFFWIPLVLAVLAGGMLCLWSRMHYRPMYASEATFTIQVSSGSGSDLAGQTSYYDKETAEQMGKTFPYLIQSELLNSKLCRYLGVSHLNGSITAQTVPDTNLFTIRVTSSDPEDAEKILKAVMTLYPDVADYVIGNSVMNVLAEPQKAEKPYNIWSPWRAAGKGAALGFALGLALLMLCAMARHTVRNTEDVRLKLNQDCLAALPRVRFKRRGSPSGNTLSIRNERVPDAFRESVRSLRMKLLRRLPGDACRVLLVTSTMPGEGKTTVAANLALSLAEGGLRVILVDLDLRRLSIKKALGLEADSAGAAEVLEKGLDAGEQLLPFGEIPLWLLAGDTASRDARRLDEDRLTHLLDSLRDRADVILLDTPPCGLLADSVNVARSADSAIYVVGSGVAEISHIQDSMQFLADSGIALTGCVLNGAEGRHGSSGYGYGYGYGYGNGYGRKRKQPENRD